MDKQMEDFKVRCTEQYNGWATRDRIYQIIDGKLTFDNGKVLSDCTSVEKINNCCRSQFELVEDKPSFKVRCVKGVSPSFHTGKIYEAKNGEIVGDDGWCYKGWSRQDSSLKSFLEWSNNGSGSQFELVTESTFTKADLRTGMRVKTREGDIYIVFLDTEDGDIIQGNWWNSLEHYEKDLTVNRDPRLDIVEVYSKPNNNSLTDATKLGKLLWQRTEPLKMTHKQIKKMIGHEFEYVKE